MRKEGIPEAKDKPVRWEENPESVRVIETRGILLLRTRGNQMKSKQIRREMIVGSMKFSGDPLSHWYPRKETSRRIIHFIRIAICPHTSLTSAMIIFNPLNLLWSTQGWKENTRILN